MTDNQQLGLIVCLLLVAAGLCGSVGDWHPATYEERVEAHWNLPKWARGDYPLRDEPRKPNRAFGLEW